MKKTERTSGILLAISSLPGNYGIGSLGAPARRFVDFLAQAQQRYWQILPLVPPGGGNSPYSSTSAYAGSPYYIDLDELAAEGYLTPQELEENRYHNCDKVDFAWLDLTRLPLLEKAFDRWKKKKYHNEPDEISLPWLGQYAHFAAMVDTYGLPFEDWKKTDKAPEDRVQFHVFLQTTFYRQWMALKKYANAQGIKIMGDIPIYLSEQSAERWGEPTLFQQEKDLSLSAVAGVPPDAFTSEGQLWGNPLYDWEGNKKGVYAFWYSRISWCSQIYDSLRIDHFRAVHTYWSIPATASSAKKGKWVEGPGMEFVDFLKSASPSLELIVEDLGDLDDDALEFMKECGMDGMNVLVFGFDPTGESAYLPHNIKENSVTYTGTHDTPTFIQWLSEGDSDSTHFAARYLRLREDEGMGWGVIAGAWATPSRLVIAPLQDVLGLGAAARMNLPGSVGNHNWTWRVRQEAFNPFVSGRLKELGETYRRNKKIESKKTKK
ncbi:MAG: 4-alpha-glucanotransferase [Eubacteriales bacterium]